MSYDDPDMEDVKQPAKLERHECGICSATVMARVGDRRFLQGKIRCFAHIGERMPERAWS